MGVERFDGLYGRAYDAVVSRPRAMRVAGAVGGRSTVLAQLPFLVRSAYAAAPDEPMLDAPCGAAGSLAHGHVVHREAPVVGVDLSRAMLERGRRRVSELLPSFEVRLVHGDALQLPFDDASFGSALSVNGLHCMPDGAAFVGELARVVRPGGELLLTTIVHTGSIANRAIERALRVGNVIPGRPPTLEALLGMLDAAGWSRAEVVGGSALVAVRCVR